MSNIFAEAIRRIEADAATVTERIRRNKAQREAIDHSIAIDQAKLDAYTSTIASLEACGPSVEEPKPKERAHRLDIGAAILADLSVAPSSRTAQELAGIINRKPSLVRAALKRLLEDDGKIVLDNGAYRLASPIGEE